MIESSRTDKSLMFDDELQLAINNNIIDNMLILILLIVEIYLFGYML